MTEITTIDDSVQIIDNHIYFYADVTPKAALAFSKLLIDANKTVRDHGSKKIWLHINTVGGDTAAMFAITDTILSSAAPVYTVIEGVAASAGSVIALAGRKRYITRNSVIMIHQGWGMTWGKLHELQDYNYMMEIMERSVINFYHERTKLSKKRIRKYLKHDWWITAKEAKEMGFVEKIL